jgi:2',3'-cyclic-nucleotide 2'-phosphodiesterase (5'-nucleotidase family)
LRSPLLIVKKAMKKTFTILHTNDMHSAFIGMGPASDYAPFKLSGSGATRHRGPPALPPVQLAK